MSLKCKVTHISKVKEDEVYEKIISIAGVDEEGEPFRISQTEAIHAIKNASLAFYVAKKNSVLKIEVGVEPLGKEYLKTEFNIDGVNFLLNLPVANQTL